MINSRRALYTVVAGIFVAASLGSGVSTDMAMLDQNGGRPTVQAPAPPISESLLPEYDTAAGEDFLVSATPAHLAKVRTEGGPTGIAGDDNRHAETCRSAAAAQHLTTGIFSESLTPAEASVQDAASATEDQTSMTLPVELTLVPGTYSLVAVRDHAWEDDSQRGFFDAVGSDGGLNFGVVQSSPPPMDPAWRLYTPFAESGPSYTPTGLETAGRALSALPSGN